MLLSDAVGVAVRVLRAVALTAYGLWPVTAVLVASLGPTWLALVVMGALVVLGVGAVLTGSLYDLWIHETARARGAWLRVRWQHVMTSAGLASAGLHVTAAGMVAGPRRRYVPKLRRVRLVPAGLVLTVRLAPGQPLDAWEKRTDALRHTWKAAVVEVVDVRPGVVRLAVTYRDPLREPRPWPG